MQRINCTTYRFTSEFDVEIDQTNRECTTVGKDVQGNYILNISEEYNMGNAYSTTEEYYTLIKQEYLGSLLKAMQNGFISKEYYELNKKM